MVPLSTQCHLWMLYSGNMLAENEEISGEGGVLVLGQEQDSPGGHFSGMSKMHNLM